MRLPRADGHYATCLSHDAPFVIDAWGDARHLTAAGDLAVDNPRDRYDIGAHCWDGPRIAWTSVDGAGSEAYPDLTDSDAARESARMQRAADATGNPFCYRYSVRRYGRMVA